MKEGPKTIEEARALKRVESTLFLASPSMEPQPLGAPISGDEIIMFTDYNGEAMKVDMWDGEWVKTPI